MIEIMPRVRWPEAVKICCRVAVSASVKGGPEQGMALRAPLGGDLPCVDIEIFERGEQPPPASEGALEGDCSSFTNTLRIDRASARSATTNRQSGCWRQSAGCVRNSVARRSCARAWWFLRAAATSALVTASAPATGKPMGWITSIMIGEMLSSATAFPPLPGVSRSLGFAAFWHGQRAGFIALLAGL